MVSKSDISMDRYNCFSPTDFRYPVEELEQYLSEDAFTKYKAKVETALVETLADYDVCSQDAVEEVKKSDEKITTEEVYEEEKRIHHDIRALVNMMGKYVSEETKPYIHATATSYDIIDTARALMYKHAVENVILPDMIELQEMFIELAREEKDTVQIGRTHGQHAEPTTFGYVISEYIQRLGNRIKKVKEAKENLVGKFSGAVGAHNATSLLIDDPQQFEEDLLDKLGLEPARVSTQIVPFEHTLDLLHSITSSFGVLANYADDMRHLQRSELAEVGEPFEEEQVGSSTMPQKRNPINFENVKSAWKEFTPRMITSYMDQISEHQRDLTNSLTQRYIPELFVMFDSSLQRMQRITKKLEVDEENMRENFQEDGDKIAAEPLQILLSYHGHPDAHEKIRKLTMKSYRTERPLTQIIQEDEELQPYLDEFTEKQREVVSNPEQYIGEAVEKTEQTCRYWEKEIEDLKDSLDTIKK